MNGTKLYVLAFSVFMFWGCGGSVEQARRFVERAGLHRDAGNYQEAVNLYRKAIEVSPKFEDAYLELALTYDEYLHNTTNAIEAYENYLAIAKDSLMKTRAQEWLQLVIAESGTPGSHSISVPETQAVYDEYYQQMENQKQSDRQLSMLQRSLSDRYERELEKMRQEVLDAREQITTLQRENEMFRSEGGVGDKELLLARMATNETVIATLQTEQERNQRERDDAVKGQSLLQSLVTNLQAELLAAMHQAARAAVLQESNSLLMADYNALKSKYQLVENTRDELQLNLADMQDKIAAVRNDGTNNSNQAMPVAMYATLESASNTIAELNRKIEFHNRERENIVSTYGNLRDVINEKNAELQKLRNSYAQLETQNVSNADIDYYRNLITAETEKRVRYEKLVYDRTLQLKRLQQRYDALQENYIAEAQQRKKITDYLASIQRESGTSGRSVARTGQTVSTASLAPARTAYTPRTETTPVAVSTQPGTRYVPPRVTPVTSTAGTAGTPTRTYTVQQGDSLLKIARKLYGDQNKWTLIFEANRNQLDGPNLLRVGQVLAIP